MESDTIAAMLYLTVYTFLLCVASEGMPLTAAGDPNATLLEEKHSAIAAQGDELVLRLARGKNHPHGAVIHRGCTCAAKQATELFDWQSPSSALGLFRLAALGVSTSEATNVESTVKLR